MEKKILLVHPDETIRAILTATLIAEGHKVSAVSNTLAAIRAITWERPGLILMDLAFPDSCAHEGGVAWDNFLVISWAGRFESNSAIPFIVLGTNDSNKDRDRALELGAMDFVPHPFETEVLVRSVNRAFELAPLA